jgi:hypothetical protein
MTASNQWSLFTSFVIFTLLAVIAATANWFGPEAVIVTLHRAGIFLAVAIVIRFVLASCLSSFRHRFKRSQTDHPIVSPDQPERKLPEVEFVIAAAEDGLVSAPDSSIRYLNLPVNDQDVAQLAECAELKWLVLDNTDVSDAGLAFLHGMTKLRRLYLRGSRVTTEGVERLQAALPDVTVLY